MADPTPPARVVELHLAVARDTPMARVDRATALVQQGFLGCRHAKRASGGKRQLLLVDLAEVEKLGLAPGQLKENVLVAGLPLSSYVPGQRLGLGSDVVVEVTENCVPCNKLNALRPGLLKESWGIRGQLARVIAGGEVREGDAVTVLEINREVPRKPMPKLPADRVVYT